MRLPAFCVTCRGWFDSGYEKPVGDAPPAPSSAAGPCPRCGGMGEVPRFEYVGPGLVRELSGPKSPERLRRLAELFNSALTTRAEPADVAAAVRAEAPECEGLARRLLVPRSAADFYTLLALLLALISLLLSQTADRLEPRDVDRLIEAIEQGQTPERAPAQEPSSSAPTGRRRDPPAGPRARQRERSASPVEAPCRRARSARAR